MSFKDLSPEKMRKGIIDASLTHPASLASAAVCFFGVVGIVLFNVPMLAVWFSGVGFGLTVISFLVNFYGRRVSLESDYIERINKLSEERTKKKLDDLKKDLDSAHNGDCSPNGDFVDFSTYLRGLSRRKKQDGVTDNKDKLMGQASKQFDLINKKFSSFKEILNKKFNPNELTYGRFYTTAEQTHGAVLDNLERIVLANKVLKDIDFAYIQERREELQKTINSGKAKDFDIQEYEAVKNREELVNKKIYEIDEILSNNEKAMTELNSITFKLSELKTSSGRSTQDLEKTLEDLVILSKSTGKYEL